MPDKHTRTLLIWWLLALLLAAGFARLGFWQMHRADEKRTQTALAEKAMRPGATVDLLSPAGATYSWAAGRGHFLPSPVVLLDNQQREGRVGVRAYALFVPEGDPQRRMLVELGWLPLDGQRDLPDVTVPTGTVEIRGLRAPPPSAGIKLGDAATNVQRKGTNLVVVYLDLPQLAQSLSLDARLWPQVLRLDPKLPFGYPRDLALLANTLAPERHVGYAVQWFGLSLTVLAVAGLLTWRRRKARK